MKKKTQADINKQKIWEVAENPPWRPRIFKTPEDLWNTALSYFQWCEANPIKQTDFRGKDATQIEIPHRQPFSIVGFCVFSGISTSHLKHLEAIYRENDDKISKDFIAIIKRIKDSCYQQKFNGAVVGVYKENIIARDLGLIDRTDATTKGKEIKSPPTELRIVRMRPEDMKEDDGK